MRQVSPRRQSEATARRRVVAEVTARDVRCRAERLVPDVRCAGTMDVHETIQRSLWAAGHLEPSNCILLCRAHHVWIDSHIELAHRLGLLRRSWERDL